MNGYAFIYNNTVDVSIHESSHDQTSDPVNIELPVHKGLPVSRYSLCKRLDKSCDNKSLHTSKCTKQVSVNYAESTDENDSDYKPKAKRHRHTNPGLCEPSQSHLESQRYINHKRRHPDSTTENDSKNNTYSLAYDEERNKKCPHCDAMFYHDKSLPIHIQHAHSNLRKSAGSRSDIDILGSNEETSAETVNTQKVENSDVNSINARPANQRVNGININTNTSVNGLNSQVNQRDMNGINHSENTGSNVLTHKKKRSPQQMSLKKKGKIKTIRQIHHRLCTKLLLKKKQTRTAVCKNLDIIKYIQNLKVNIAVQHSHLMSWIRTSHQSNLS